MIPRAQKVLGQAGALFRTVLGIGLGAYYYGRKRYFDLDRYFAHAVVETLKRVRVPERFVPDRLRHDAQIHTRMRQFRRSQDPINGSIKMIDLRSSIIAGRSRVDGIWTSLSSSTQVARVCDVDKSALRALKSTFDKYQDEGKGMVIAFPHAGSLTVIPHFLNANGMQPAFVHAAPPQNENGNTSRLSRLRNVLLTRGGIKAAALRRVHTNGLSRLIRNSGSETIGLTVYGGAAMLAACEDAMGRGKVALIASDLAMGPGGIQTIMAGLPRKVGRGPALLAIRNQVPVVIVGAFPTPSGIKIEISHPINPPSQDEFGKGDLWRQSRLLTSRISAATGHMLSRHPGHWTYSGHWDSPDVPGSEIRTKIRHRDLEIEKAHTQVEPTPIPQRDRPTAPVLDRQTQEPHHELG